MSKSCTRIKKPNIPTDLLNSNIDWVNVAVSTSNAVFTNDLYNSGLFTRNSYLYSNKTATDYSLKFSDIFTITFWAKAQAGAITDTVYPNKFVFAYDGTSTNILSVNIPSTVTITDWNHYDITRSTDGNTYMRINGTTIGSLTANASILNLLSDSYLFLGNENTYATGYNMIVDDILIIDAVLWDTDYTKMPTDYIDVSSFSHCLFMKPSTGEIWGYQKES